MAKKSKGKKEPKKESKSYEAKEMKGLSPMKKGCK